MKKLNLIICLHLLWILIILISLPLAVFFIWYRKIALILVIINILSWFFWKDCPLMKWENEVRLKNKIGSVYREAFVTHYIKQYLHIYIPSYLVKVFLYGYGLILLVVCLF